MRLSGKRTIITQSTEYMGPAVAELFAEEGAELIERPGPVPFGEAFTEWVRNLTEEAEILIANLACDPHSAPVAEIRNQHWEMLFDQMVHPLMCLIRHFAPRMAARGRGKIVAITSATPLRGLPGTTAYCAARGAQNAFVRAAGLEFAAQGVNINAIAQNYVSNPAYYPDDLVESERFQQHLRRNVPIGRIANAQESAERALFLASDKNEFIVGQVIPFSGGWATNA